MSHDVLLDTHILLWLIAEPSRLSPAAQQALDAAPRVLVSAITCWEIALKHRRGKLQLDRPPREWFQAALRPARMQELSLTAAAALRSVEMEGEGFHNDPADRFLAAAAISEGLPLITADHLILAWAQGPGNGQLRTIG